MKKITLVVLFFLFLTIGNSFSQNINFVLNIKDVKSLEPVVNAIVELVPVAGGANLKSNSNYSGDAFFKNVEIGAYNISIRHPAYVPFDTTGFHIYERNDKPSVRLKKKKQLNVQFDIFDQETEQRLQDVEISFKVGKNNMQQIAPRVNENGSLEVDLETWQDELTFLIRRPSTHHEQRIERSILPNQKKISIRANLIRNASFPAKTTQVNVFVTNQSSKQYLSNVRVYHYEKQERKGPFNTNEEGYTYFGISSNFKKRSIRIEAIKDGYILKDTIVTIMGYSEPETQNIVPLSLKPRPNETPLEISLTRYFKGQTLPISNIKVNLIDPSNKEIIEKTISDGNGISLFHSDLSAYELLLIEALPEKKFVRKTKNFQVGLDEMKQNLVLRKAGFKLSCRDCKLIGYGGLILGGLSIGIAELELSSISDEGNKNWRSQLNNGQTLRRAGSAFGTIGGLALMYAVLHKCNGKINSKGYTRRIKPMFKNNFLGMHYGFLAKF